MDVIVGPEELLCVLCGEFTGKYYILGKTIIVCKDCQNRALPIAAEKIFVKYKKMLPIEYVNLREDDDLH